MHDISNYEKIRLDAEHYFQSLKPVFCAAVNETVKFPSESFNHIIYKTARRERNKEEQIMRFKLLPKAYELVSKATIYQEYEESIQQVEQHTNKKRARVTKPVIYWGLIGIIGNYKIKVILRKRGNSGIHFWSIVPAWTTNKYKDIKFSSTMKGIPEED